MNAPAAATLPVLILHTGDPDDTLRLRHGGYAQMLRHAAGLEPQAAHIVRVCAGERPLAPPAYRAALITGSPAMVTDREPWSEQTAAWLRRAAQAGMPIFGVCYGHQLLAHALGGAVDDNPRGRELGTRSVECLPAGAVALARSALDAHQLVRWAPRVYSAQFHPEFGPEFMRDHLRRHQAGYAREGIDAAALARAVLATPTAAGLLRRFLGLRQMAAAARG